MVVRIYTGNDGESHFQELTPDEFAAIGGGLPTLPSLSAPGQQPL